MTTFGARLTCAMSRRTQTWLANQVGVTQTAVSYWQNGRRLPELQMVYRIAEVLDVEPGWLAFGPAAAFADERWREVTSALGYGDGITEPQIGYREFIEVMKERLRIADDDAERARYAEARLAALKAEARVDKDVVDEYGCACGGGCGDQDGGV